jgi:toxin YoeB
MTTVNVTEARASLYKLIDDTSESHEPVVITGKRGNAVLLAEGDWNAITETLHLLSVPGMRESILEGKQAQKDAIKLASSGLKAKAQTLLAILEEDPWQNPPPFEKLVGNLSGAYSRRINIQHRLVYQVLEAEKAVKILRLWTHYE